MLNKVISSALLLFSCSSVFASNGYWQENRVCDYKTIKERVPFTQCSWGGNISGFAGGKFYDDGWVEVSKQYDSHIECSSSIIHTVRKSEDGRTPGHSLSGTLYLYEHEYGYNYVNKRVKDEQSCRVERIWISCDGPHTCE